MGKIKVQGKKVFFQRKDELTVVEPYGPDCIRCRSTKNSTIADEDWTLLEPTLEDHTVIEEKENWVKITNGHISVTIEAEYLIFGGVLTYYKDGKQILRTKFEGDYTNKNKHVEGNHYQIEVIFFANEGEHFYGMGQETEDILDRKGSTSQIIHYNTKSALPVLYSSLGYGILWNNPAPGRVEMTKNHTMFVADSAYQADYLIYGGETPAETMKLYCGLTGFAPKFPEWAAGFWQCKLRYESQEELLTVAREYKKRGIPIDAIVIDFFHWTEQGEWKFDSKYWPDPKAMIEELRSLQIEPVVSIWPTINPNSENYDEMNESNMLVRTENGQYGTFEFHGQQTFIDTMNPDTRKYVWYKVMKHYYTYGIRTFWLDEAEPEVHPQQPSHIKYYLGNGAQVAQLYPYYYAKTFFDGLKKAGEEEIVILTRAAYPGSQKFGTVVWNGDIQSTFENLKMSVKSGLSMAMSGIPWWNSDIGGFWGGDIESDYFKELIVRWFQFGLFCPVMRLHGVRNKQTGYIERHPGILEPSGGNNEIWSFGERNYPILKHLIELREKLKPYICEQMEITSRMGTPIMRPLFFDFYKDKHCYEIEDEYLFGSDIIFAPIVEQGQIEREVYLPEGTWVNVNDGKSYSGKDTYTCKAKVEEFIAFVKEDRTELCSIFIN